MLYGFEDTYEEQEAQSCLQAENGQDQGPFFVEVFNTCTNGYETVEVSRDVYLEFRRAEWREKKAQKSFYKHEIQFSSMCDSVRESVENYREFLLRDNDPALLLEEQELIRRLHLAINSLTSDEQNYISKLFFQNASQEKLAKELGINQSSVSRRLSTILKKIKNILEADA